ncbi:DUF397 domain-containing protein [Actinomadura kijaniata]|uniref:DUF397 domain-containing protein n=1 Tax=Actinomadura kijaniata TaxID=46161 RepID=UPI003F1D5BE5
MELTRTRWRKSSHSSAEGDNCVELSAVSDVVLMRDSKSPGAGTIAMADAEFRQFMRAIKRDGAGSVAG